MRRVALLGLVALALAGCDDNSGGTAKQAAPGATTTGKPAAAPEKGPPPGPTQHFRSRPDLHPPVVKVDVAAHGTAPGYIFLAPKMAVAQAGPMIMSAFTQARLRIVPTMWKSTSKLGPASTTQKRTVWPGSAVSG